jgi:hypothetical protein
MLPGFPPLPLRIRFATPNERLTGAIRMKIQVSDFERHEFSASRERRLERQKVP